MLLRLLCVVYLASPIGGLGLPARWNVLLNLGRPEGSRMPADWGASGARLFVQSEVELVSDEAAGDDSERKFLGRRSDALRLVASNGTFTGLGGKCDVAIRRDAAWTLASDKEPMALRFWLDFSDAQASSRGVDLPAEKLFFTTTVFDDALVTELKKKVAAAKQAVFTAQAALDVDKGGGPLSRSRLSMALDSARRELDDLERRIPAAQQKLTPGPIPGLEGRALVDSGRSAVVSVKRRTFFGDQYLPVGTCSLTPVLEGAELAASKRLYY